MNFAGIFLGLLFLATGAAGFLLSARVTALAHPSADGALGFEPSGDAGLVAPDEHTTYVAVSTDRSSPVHRLLSMLLLAILVGAVATFSAWIVWGIGSFIVHAFLSKFAGD